MRKFNSWGNNRQHQHRGQMNGPLGKFDPRVDNSREILNSFTFRTVKADYGEDSERLLRRFKRVVEASGVMAELKKREHFKSSSQKRREQRLESMKNVRKRKAKLERMMDFDSKKVITRPHNQRRQQDVERRSNVIS